MLPISSVLWPSDGSEQSFKALQAAVEIASRFEAKLYALQVVQQVPTVTGAGFTPTAIQGFDVPLYEQELIKMVEQELHDTLSTKVPEGLEVISRVKLGIPADTIVDFAQENSIGMIVMATHGRTGLSHFMIGSVAEKTIRQSSVPTLIIPDSSPSE
ncbi:MAG: universal stress protein [Desulfopila sp.]|jgi:nucleotide-binding universal stress UspA family protein|nr:universal stress protein [Desulfopila sp.]